MTKPPLKVGMVGAGFILKPHALSVASIEGTTLHAVADTSHQRAAGAAKEFGFAHALSSVEEVATSDCDIVHVLVPPFLHVDVAEALLTAGKSVFLEKPMGLSSKDCLRLGALAHERGLSLGVNHNFLFLPGYERLRNALSTGSLGHVDQLTCGWNYELPQLKSGPFDAWMLSAPENLFFEVGSHLAAIVLDLLGESTVSAAAVSNPIDLPTGKQAYRSWAALGSGSRGQFNLSLSTQPGQPDRIIRVRASGGSAQLDFGRDLYWEERTQTENPIFDAYAVAVATSRQLRSSAGRDRRRRITAALRKALGSEPFSESIARSISTFYANIETGLDNRHDWKFGASTIQLCEEVCASAGMGQPSALPISVSVPRTDSSAPATVLVVGGTGFIGRALVAKLIDNGVRVRVLSRSRNAAAIAFAGMPVEVCEGSHGSRGDARKALAGIEVVFHLAKCEGKRWDDYLKGDIEPTRVLAEESVAAGVKRFIYTGTIDSYDSATPRNRITGDTPVDAHINRRNLYARSKAACEKILHELGRAHGLPVIVLRPAIVIGAGAPPAHNGIAQFASETDVRYWGRGDNKLPLVLVDDVADALAAAAEAPGIIGRSFVLTSEPMMSAREYVRELEASSGVKIRDRRRSPWRYWVADVIKEIAKNVIRHPNRRWPSLHDWRCRAHRSTYDNSGARDALAWEPVTDRSILVERGIQTAVASSIK